jgi:transposase InsO family protein
MQDQMQQGGLNIDEMCWMVSASRAGYYRRWKASRPREEETALRDRLQKLALAHPHYGYRRIGALFRREGWQVNHKRVLRLLRTDNLLCMRKKAFVPATTDSRHAWLVWPNLTRGMKTTGINQLWVADITYIRLKEEFVYLAVVLDAHSRCIVGWDIERHLGSILAIRALKMALTHRTPEPNMIHHSDRGFQYACMDYVRILQSCGIQISMSRVGNPYDNAKAESFMKTLKTEEVNGSDYRNFEHVCEAISDFLENVYNRKRLHSALDYLSPIEFEENLLLVGKNSTLLDVGEGGNCPLPPHPLPRVKSILDQICP